ncbi:MAG: Uma2 family endonuclease [Phototrophicaceae bacterium]
MVQPTQTRTTANDYYASDAYAQNDLIQLIEGEVIILMPPILKHQRLVREILILLSLIAREKGGEALDSPVEVYLDEDNIYQPDVLYLSVDTQCTVEEKRLVGAPELVVEVLSPSTAKYDRQQKYQAYEKHGVHDYCIIDPIHEIVEVWSLNAQKKFERQGAFAVGDTFQSAVLGASVDVTAIFNI